MSELLKDWAAIEPLLDELLALPPQERDERLQALPPEQQPLRPALGSPDDRLLTFTEATLLLRCPGGGTQNVPSGVPESGPAQREDRSHTVRDRLKPRASSPRGLTGLTASST